MSLRLSVLTIGDELLSGELSDTNTAAIARLLAPQGLKIRDRLTVADDETEIAEALSLLAAKRDLVIVTGGLGPTRDDLTARAAARAFGRRLVLDDEALRQIRNHFARLGRPMHAGNDKQALLPQKCTILPNLRGTAPGFMLQAGKTDLYFLPGVPSEMLLMLQEQVLPRIQNRTGHLSPLRELIIQLFGLPEPRCEEMLKSAALPEGVEVAWGIDYPVILAKFRAGGEEAESLLDRAEMQARRAFGDHIIAIGEGSLPQTLGKLLLASGKTLSLAESCTGGLIAKMLTDMPGSSGFLERAGVVYANAAKTDWLGVPAELIEGEGAVSEACALAMARGVRLAAGTDFALSVTGIAGPKGGTPDKPVGTVFIALCGPQGEAVKRCRFNGNRQEVRILTAFTALDWLRRTL